MKDSRCVGIVAEGRRISCDRYDTGAKQILCWEEGGGDVMAWLFRGAKIDTVTISLETMYIIPVSSTVEK